MKNLKELEELQKVAVEITRLCAEYSQRAETESHEDLEPLWNRIQELKNQVNYSATSNRASLGYTLRTFPVLPVC